MPIETAVSSPFATISDCVRQTARLSPAHPALIEDHRVLGYGELDQLMDRVGTSLQRDGLQAGSVIAVSATSSIEYVAIFLGALRVGVTVAPLAPGLRAEDHAAMVADSGARLFFADAPVLDQLEASGDTTRSRLIALDDSSSDIAFRDWLADASSVPTAVHIAPELAFNIIYSSGTTGQPKGIVQSHAMRWGHVQRAAPNYGVRATTLLSTPLYSNTTLGSFFPTMALSGTVVLMAKFEAGAYLALAQKHRVSHTMLVPVQYQRIMAHPDFERYDLSSFRMKYCTSAPFSAALKADVLRRWPGGLTELYGMTEGGGTCMLAAHEFPHKLHTVGRPAPGTDIRVIDDHGVEVASGGTGEVVGHSKTMMTGYHNNPGKTAEAEWYDPDGKRFIRTGDIGRFDENGFLVLVDRKKDMIISGGFNIYPSDLEALVQQHEEVAEVSVIGVPSERWGETPVAFVVFEPGSSLQPETLREWANSRLGKTQRLSGVQPVKELPRSAIGKVLKRELRELYVGE